MATYFVIGMILSIITMPSSWEYWIEFGLIGFIFQFVYSSAMWPLMVGSLIYYHIKEMKRYE